ncbi:adenylate cyclase [Homalodisca vitripennis]|nr:adenylate cyclase [Homalodisca vitripennis]
MPHRSKRLSMEEDENKKEVHRPKLLYIDRIDILTAGHGSLFLESTAGEKLAYILRKFMEKTTVEEQELEENSNLMLGDVTSINLSKNEGGVQTNAVPPELKAVFDSRVSLDEDHD